MKKYLFSVFLFLGIPLFVQDTTDFFPHHVGDMWEYYEVEFGTGRVLDTLQFLISSDSTDESGLTHIERLQRFIRPPYPWSRKKFWLDSLNRVWGPYYGGVNLDSALLYKLNARKGDKWVLTELGENAYEMARVRDMYRDVIFSDTLTIMVMNYYYTSDSTDTLGLDTYYDLLADGIGLVVRSGGYDYGWEWYLKGAVIDGRLIGDTTLITNINLKNHPIPQHITLDQNYPNPFNSQTRIQFTLNRSSQVSLVIYDITGKEVIKPISKQMLPPGNHEISWNGKNEKGGEASSGVYIYQLEFPGGTLKKKMILIR